MSGGVDSSVAALLLKERGYEVIGATLNLWSYEGRLEPYNECCSLEVSVVAKQLGIEHHFLDLGALFKQHVVDSFISDYLSGRTPSPCMRCNRLIRFPLLLEHARKLNCDYLATGHHARVVCEDGVFYLKKGRDRFKDQSYFLFHLTQDALKRLLLPIGDYQKEEVWEIARRHNLVSARKPESQDLCFLPRGDYRAYLKAKSNGHIREGEIVDLAGNVLGHHKGLAFYTIGQRSGLGVALGKRAYVVDLDAQKNRVIVGSEEHLMSHGLIASEVSLVYKRGQQAPEDVEVKIRYRSEPVEATITPLEEGKAEVRFKRPQKAVTPGQAVVFYKGDTVFGGGIIERALVA